MRISVFGCGYLGTVHAACLVEQGHDVVGVEVDADRVDALSRGECPFFEPDLDDLLRAGLDAGRLEFSKDPAAAHDATVHFLCVGTPQQQDGPAADLSQIDSAFAMVLSVVKPGDVVVGKSTVPVGTAERLAAALAAAQPGTTLVWNPEFLREGKAVADSLRPDRVVYGHAGDAQGRRACEVLDLVYAQVVAAGTPRIETDLATAQLVKVAANSFLATKVSFINAMAELCEATGGDVAVLADAIGLDARIGRSYLNAGIGFGGGCLPKDIRAFMARADELGVDQALTFLREVDSINRRRRERMLDLAREACGGALAGRRVAVLGAAFKPDSDDVRESPAMEVAVLMRADGAEVTVTDPRAVGNARAKWPDFRYTASVADAVAGADLVLVLTEWREYTELDPRSLSSLVRTPRVIDGRNCLDPEAWRAAGWAYRALGRP